MLYRLNKYILLLQKTLPKHDKKAARKSAWIDGYVRTEKWVNGNETVFMARQAELIQ